MASTWLGDRQLSTLAFQDDDDTLSDTDVLLGDGQAGDLAALFNHLRLS